MHTSTTTLLQSRFFSPCFNTAIFDGPLRLYFAEHQEDEALKMYFSLQKHFAELKWSDLETETGNRNDKALFLMLYPTKETYDQTFTSNQSVAKEKLGESDVVGLCPSACDQKMNLLFDLVKEVFRRWGLE
jgi:hypothetical protein